MYEVMRDDIPVESRTVCRQHAGKLMLSRFVRSKARGMRGEMSGCRV